MLSQRAQTVGEITSPEFLAQHGNAKLIDFEDKLLVSIWNSVASPSVKIQGRIMSFNGRVVPISETVVPNTDRTRSDHFINVAPGYLLDLVIFPDFTVRTGQCFVSAGLIRGTSVNTNRVAPLVQDYLQTGNFIAFPNGRVINSVDSEGLVYIPSSTDPAADTASIETVPTNARWTLKSSLIGFTTAAGGSDRTVAFQVLDGTDVLFHLKMPVNQAGGTSKTYFVTDEIAEIADVTNLIATRIPREFKMSQGWQIKWTWSNSVTGDNLTAPKNAVTEVIEE